MLKMVRGFTNGNLKFLADEESPLYRMRSLVLRVVEAVLKKPQRVPDQHLLFFAGNPEQGHTHSLQDLLDRTWDGEFDGPEGLQKLRAYWKYFCSDENLRGRSQCWSPGCHFCLPGDTDLLSICNKQDPNYERILSRSSSSSFQIMRQRTRTFTLHHTCETP